MPSILNSWKEIAAYLNRGVRTVQRWERHEGLPIRRIGKGSRAPVYALADEIDKWLRRRTAADDDRLQAVSQSETHRRVSQTQQLISMSERAGLTLVSVDLDIALTMARIALDAGQHKEKRTRNQKMARRAYNTLLHLSQRLKIPTEERSATTEKFADLKQILMKLGERF